MHLASDYTDRTPQGGRCRVRIFEPDQDRDSFMVILTELPYNPGMSITNAAEEIVSGGVLKNALLTSCTIFDLITFSAEDPEPVLRAGVCASEMGEPSWSALARLTVERLMGGPVEYSVVYSPDCVGWLFSGVRSIQGTDRGTLS